ncbi:PREDICTED: uncharacterized protein LOC108566074 [Nicrophorus vespilloides]|uniref:Uncharacterized protein LOC108566074 n=1 Tax=Nicrophorus vespilloides TaxID=110193 RepID=A0ABM1N367_NICVS|nr:PREDICTED: uncharacterized protein LOC108566074 [Nicrophorus vespilloides]
MERMKGVLNQENINSMKRIVDLGLAKSLKEAELRHILYEKYQALNTWYNRTIGTEELRKYQNQVTELQERLFTIQEARRTIGQNLQAIRDKSHVIQDDLQKTNRQNNFEKYMKLLREETENMKTEQELTKLLNDQERCERDVCSAFTSAIHNAHEKQRAQIENTKYFGILISFTGSFLTFLYSSIRSDDIKKVIKKNMTIELEPIVRRLEENIEKMEVNSNKVTIMGNKAQDDFKKLSDTVKAYTSNTKEVLDGGLTSKESSASDDINNKGSHIPVTEILIGTVIFSLFLIVFGK